MISVSGFKALAACLCAVCRNDCATLTFMKVDKKQFDSLLGKMLTAEPLKREDVKRDKKKKAKLIEPRPSSVQSNRRKASV